MALEFPVESGGNDPVATAPRFCSGVVSSGGRAFEALCSQFSHTLYRSSVPLLSGVALRYAQSEPVTIAQLQILRPLC